MEQAYAIAAIWLALALLATFVASWMRISTALVEIVVGVMAGAVAVRFFGEGALGAKLPWLTFLASSGAIVLTFLAGAELDPAVLRAKWKETTLVGLVGFLAPFLGCSAIARFLLGWSMRASLLAGVALSTTSMAVVYAVLLELGLNQTSFGKGILGACFLNDLGTVIALALLFAPFGIRTLVFVAGSAAAFAAMPFLTPRLLARFRGRPTEVETKWILLILFGLGALAAWAGSEAVLPAYVSGMVLAGTVGRDHGYIRRLRTLTMGLLTPFYFLRAGSFVSVAALVAAPLVVLSLLAGKVVSKVAGLFPVIGWFRSERRERWYYTLMMSTGLTFGTISALYGLTHDIISQVQYSHLVAVVIGSAIVPTMIANAIFLPHHLLPEAESNGRAAETVLGAAAATTTLDRPHSKEVGSVCQDPRRL